MAADVPLSFALSVFIFFAFFAPLLPSFLPLKCRFQKKLLTFSFFASIPLPSLLAAIFCSFLSPPLFIGVSEVFCGGKATRKSLLKSKKKTKKTKKKKKKKNPENKPKNKRKRTRKSPKAPKHPEKKQSQNRQENSPPPDDSPQELPPKTENHSGQHLYRAQPK